MRDEYTLRLIDMLMQRIAVLQARLDRKIRLCDGYKQQEVVFNDVIQQLMKNGGKIDSEVRNAKVDEGLLLTPYEPPFERWDKEE